MTEWDELEPKIKGYLESLKKDGIWYCEYFRDLDNTNLKSKSDGMLFNGSTIFAVEYENTQHHPDTNVGKYWQLYSCLHENHKEKRIVLYHVYVVESPKQGRHFQKSSHMLLSEFYEKRMKSEFGFVHIPRYFCRNTNPDIALKDIKTDISEEIKQWFGKQE